jgi:hypothetical protein
MGGWSDQRSDTFSVSGFGSLTFRRRKSQVRIPLLALNPIFRSEMDEPERSATARIEVVKILPLPLSFACQALVL